MGIKKRQKWFSFFYRSFDNVLQVLQIHQIETQYTILEHIKKD